MTESYTAKSVRAARQRLIESGVGARGPAPDSLGVPAAIERSWRRSIVLDSPATPTTQPPFRPLAGRADPLSEASRSVLDRWSDSLADARVALLVSDRRGRIIARRVADARHARKLDRVFAAEGFDFSESVLGTNGIGTVMEEGSALLVRGAEHFNELLEPFACAGAPIRETGTGRVIGSVSLASPAGEANPAMIAIVRQAALQIEESMSEASSPQELRALLSLFTGGSSQRPVVALSRGGMLGTNGALPWLTTASHALLWDELKSYDWSGQSTNVSLAGRPGNARRIAGHDGGHVYIIEFEEALDPGQDEPDPYASRPGALALTHRLDELAARSGAVTVSGPTGSGKTHLARTWLQHRDGALPLVLEATDLRGASLRDQVASRLRAGTSVLVRRVEALGSEDIGWLRTIIELPDPRGRARLALTLSDPAIHPDLRQVVDRLAPDVSVPALHHEPERIVAIAQEVAAEYGATLSSAVVQALVRWDWPGEVTELVSLLGRVCRASVDATVGIEALPTQMRTRARQLYGIAASEYRAIETALREAGGNRSLAAESLGIGRTTLYRKMRTYGLDGRADLTA